MSLVKFSTVGKLDGIRSWSLQAQKTCPGSFGPDGNLVPVCSGCYAADGNYRLPSVQQIRRFNQKDWKRASWEDDMVETLDDDRYFRWLDSGDLYTLALANKVYRIMVRTPWVKHWLPTRMYKFPKFRKVLEAMQALPNVMVRYSSDEVDGSFIPGLHGSTVVELGNPAPEGAKLCTATATAGKCNGCRSCWNKEVPVVAYSTHGTVMKKVIRLKKESLCIEK